MLKDRIDIIKIISYVFVFVFSMLCLMPFVMVISGSLSIESDILNYGYSMVPKHISLLSYKILLLDLNRILGAYKITIIVTVSGTLLALFINTMAGYSMSRKSLKYMVGAVKG